MDQSGMLEQGWSMAPGHVCEGARELHNKEGYTVRAPVGAEDMSSCPLGAEEPAGEEVTAPELGRRSNGM
jgi:hypothetical protein